MSQILLITGGVTLSIAIALGCIVRALKYKSKIVWIIMAVLAVTGLVLLIGSLITANKKSDNPPQTLTIQELSRKFWVLGTAAEQNGTGSDTFTAIIADYTAPDVITFLLSNNTEFASGSLSGLQLSQVRAMYDEIPIPASSGVFSADGNTLTWTDGTIWSKIKQ